MKARMNRKQLVEALDVASAATEQPKTQPLLSHVLLDCSDGAATLMGVSLIGRAWASLPAATDGEILAAFSADAPLAMLRRAEADDVEITATDRRVSFTAGGSEVTMPRIDAQNFPPVPDFSAPQFDTTVDAAALYEALAAVSGIPADLDSNVYKTGVRIEIAGGFLTALAADTSRGAFRRVAVSNDVAEGAVLAYGKGLRLAVSRLKGAQTARLALSSDGADLLLDTEAGSWVVRALAADRYPDIRGLFRPSDHEVLADRRALLSAAHSVEQIAALNAGFLTIMGDADGLVVGAKTSEESAVARVPHPGMPTVDDVSLNAKAFVQALESFKVDVVRLRWSTMRPFLIDDGDDTEAGAAIMPRATK